MENQDWYQRLLVAKNPKTPLEALLKLAKETVERDNISVPSYVANQAIRNPRFPK